MKSILAYSLLIILVIVGYPFMDDLLFKGFGIRDVHVVAFIAIASLFYLKHQFYFATSGNLGDKSKDDIASFIPAGVLLVVVILMVIFYKKHFFMDWYIDVIIVAITIWIDVSIGNYVGNLILKKTSEVTPMK